MRCGRAPSSLWPKPCSTAITPSRTPWRTCAVATTEPVGVAILTLSPVFTPSRAASVAEMPAAFSGWSPRRRRPTIE